MVDDDTRDAGSRPIAPNIDGTRKSDALVEHRERTIQDDTGRVWTVSERKLTSDSPDGASLLFVSDYSIRRVRDYPANWFQHSDAELFAVSLSR